MVSLFLWGCKTVYPTNFDQFVNNVKNNRYQDFNRVRYRSQLEWITDSDGTIKIKNLLRYENLEQEFESFLKQIDIPPFKLLVKNTAYDKSKIIRKPFDAYYSNVETRRLVEEVWAEDFEVFNYQKI